VVPALCLYRTNVKISPLGKLRLDESAHERHVGVQAIIHVQGDAGAAATCASDERVQKGDCCSWREVALSVSSRESDRVGDNVGVLAGQKRLFN